MRQIPIRVFLLSNNCFLREALCHVLDSHADVLVVGAKESSAGAIAEIIESACDVLLVERFRLDDFDRQVLDRLEKTLVGPKIVAIEMEAQITDAISAIRMAVQGETGPL